MFMRTIGRRGIKPFIVCALSLAVPLANGQTPAASQAPASGSEIEQLRRMILDQQRQIDELKRAMADRRSSDSTVATIPDAPTAEVATSSRGGIGEIASTTPVLPPIPVLTTAVVPLPAPQAAAAAPTDALQKAIDAINGNLRGFRLSGDFRLRFDTLDRSANTNFGSSDNRSTPMQRDRERYRVRINFDKDLFYKDGADRSLATFHLQLATDPFNNPNTMDTDFAGLATRAPISIAEAYMDLSRPRA